MEQQDIFSPPDPNESIFQREERCRKALKTVARAIGMRLVILALLFWIVAAAGTELWVKAMLALVAGFNAATLMPLVREWKLQRSKLRDILLEEENTP